jgi:hypothetical protein
MNRKRWTPKETVTQADLLMREKKKWQLALRRYVLEKKPSPFYAPYFGIDVEGFRQWVALHFTDGLGWDNFGQRWQFDHLVPLACFDFGNENDLKLCWHFLNIGVERLETTGQWGKTVELLAVKAHFARLYQQTGYDICQKMLNKLTGLEAAAAQGNPATESFILERKADLEAMATLNEQEFAQLNTGTSLKDLLLQRQILSRFGG